MSAESTYVIDSLVMPGESLFGAGIAEARLFETLTRAGIEAAVLVAPRGQDYVLPVGNDRIAALVREAPDTRRQLGRVDPNHRDALAEVDRCVLELGVAGFYLNPREENFAIDGRRAAAVLESVAEHGLPLVVQSGVPWVSEPLQVAVVAERHPELDIVMTNGGQFNISGLGQADAFESLERCPRLRINTSGVYRQDFIDGVIDRFGASRVLFASSCPVFDPRYELLRVLGADCSPQDRATVAAATARGLFW